MAADHVSLSIFLERLGLMLGGVALGVAVIFGGFRLGAKRFGTKIERYNTAGYVFTATLFVATIIFGVVVGLWPS